MRGSAKKHKKSFKSVIGDPHDCRWQNQEVSEREMKQQKNHLVKNGARLLCRQVIAKPAWGWKPETNPPIYGENIHIHDEEGGGLTVCDHVCLPQRWHSGQHRTEDLDGQSVAWMVAQLCIITHQLVWIWGSLYNMDQEHVLSSIITSLSENCVFLSRRNVLLVLNSTNTCVSRLLLCVVPSAYLLPLWKLLRIVIMVLLWKKSRNNRVTDSNSSNNTLWFKEEALFQPLCKYYNYSPSV